MSSNNGDAASASGTHATLISGKIMLGAIIVLFIVVVVMVFLHLYARWYLLCTRRSRNNHTRHTHLVFYLDPSSPVAAAKRGLDASLLETIPTFTYSKGRDVIMECAVCLSQFEEGEAGRQLPGCGHCFHVDCIDMWFHSHSTCPLCRSPVNAQIIPVQANESSVADSMVIKIEVETSEPELEKRPLPSWGSGTSCGAAAAGDFDVEQG